MSVDSMLCSSVNPRGILLLSCNSLFCFGVEEGVFLSLCGYTLTWGQKDTTCPTPKSPSDTSTREMPCSL